MGWLSPTKCGLCESPLKRKSYGAVVNGRRLTICPTCAADLARRKSRDAIDRLVAGEDPVPAPPAKRGTGCVVVLVTLLLAGLVAVIMIMVGSQP